MKRFFPSGWGLIGEALLRLLGTALAAYIIRYMCLEYLDGNYLRNDQVLTLIAIMIFIAMFVFSVVISVFTLWKRHRNTRPPTPGA